jgi:hypothetical protein
VPLRSPSAVTKQVQKYLTIQVPSSQTSTRNLMIRNPMDVTDYTSPSMPAATDGTDVIKLQHRRGQGGHHDDPLHCTACGEGIAQCLTDTLHVGKSRRGKKFIIT